MQDALIGWSGFVGSSLLRQRDFDVRYRSTDIADIHGRSFGIVVCAGASARKWVANSEPEADAAAIDALIGHLAEVRCEAFALISTVDVFKDPVGVDEASAVDESGLHAYGLNRRRLEKFVLEHFPRAIIVRLPGLVGPGLRKNIVYDLHNDNNLNSIDSRSVFQFYPTVNLWPDLNTAIGIGVDVVHLTAEPVSVAEIAAAGFGRHFDNPCSPGSVRYDFRTRYADRFGGSGPYQYSRKATLLAVRAYAQSEPRRSKV